MCGYPVTYTGTVCRDELLAMTECFPEDSLTPDLLVVFDASMQQQTLSLINSLELFGSPECVAAATPFLCVYLFEGVCDGSGTLYLPTMAECEELSAGVCKAEFELARSVGMTLANCAQLPRESPSLCADSSQTGGMNETFDENGN
jgi:hypothetical protein